MRLQFRLREVLLKSNDFLQLSMALFGGLICNWKRIGFPRDLYISFVTSVGKDFILKSKENLVLEVDKVLKLPSLRRIQYFKNSGYSSK